MVASVSSEGKKERPTPPPPSPPKQKTKKTEVLAPDTLVSILQYFFAEINKKDGNYYEASSLAAKFGCSTDWYLRESNYEFKRQQWDSNPQPVIL